MIRQVAIERMTGGFRINSILFFFGPLFGHHLATISRKREGKIIKDIGNDHYNMPIIIMHYIWVCSIGFQEMYVFNKDG